MNVEMKMKDVTDVEFKDVEPKSEYSRGFFCGLVGGLAIGGAAAIVGMFLAMIF